MIKQISYFDFTYKTTQFRKTNFATDPLSRLRQQNYNALGALVKMQSEPEIKIKSQRHDLLHPMVILTLRLFPSAIV